MAEYYGNVIDWEMLKKHIRLFRMFLHEMAVCNICKYKVKDESLLYDFCKCPPSDKGRILCQLVRDLCVVLSEFEKEIDTALVKVELPNFDELSKKLDEYLMELSDKENECIDDVKPIKLKEG